MNKKLWIVALTASLFTCNAMAEGNSGVYFGAGYGSTAFADDDLGKNSNVNQGELKEDTDNGVVVYGGYKFNNIIAVEASYRNYGKFTYKNGGSLEASSFAVSANVGYAFLENQLRPFAVAGIGIVSVDYALGNSVIQLDDTAGAFHYGFGLEYEPNALNGLGFRIAYEGDIYAIELQGVGVDDKTYSQSLGQLYLGVQYRF